MKKPLNSKHYINYLTYEQKELNTNYRNNFTTEYYDKLINMKNKNDILNEIKNILLNLFTTSKKV